MNKLKFLLTMLLSAVVGIGVHAETHVWDPTALTNGTVIALQCRDTNGGPGWYFNGEGKKSPVLNYHNLYKVVTAVSDGSAIKLQRLWDSKYVSTEGSMTMVAEGADNVATFAVTNAQPENWTTSMAGTDATKMLRFATGSSSFLNTAAKTAVPTYSGGRGGYSAWYVYTFSEAEVTALTANPSGLKVSTDTEEHWYVMQCLRASRYVGTAAVGQNINGHQTTIPTVWKFVKRDDGSWDIVDYNGIYVSVSGGNIKAADTRPSYGWTIKNSAQAGYFIVTSGGSQFNQSNDSPYPTLNWGGGNNTTDEGCKYCFAEAPAPATPKQLMYLTSGWYQIKSVSGVQGATGKYLKTLDLSAAVLHSSNYYDMVETESSTDLNTYCYVKRGETVQVYLPNGHNVGTGCSSSAQTPVNNINVWTPDADLSRIQLRNDGSHGTNYWYIFDKTVNSTTYKILGAGSGVTTSRFQFYPVDMSGYDIYTVALGDGVTGTDTVTYNKSDYTGVKEMIVGGNVFVTKGSTLEASDFTSSQSGTIVSIDADNKRIMVNLKPNIDFSELSNAKKYIIKTARGFLNATATTASGSTTQSVEVAMYKYAETNHYYLYDVTNSKFLGTSDLSSTADPTTYFEVSQWDTNAKEFKIKSSATKCLLQMNGAGALVINDGWSTKDAGDIWYVYEAGDFTMPAELVTKIANCETIQTEPITDLSQLVTTKVYVFKNRNYDGYLKGNTTGGRLLFAENTTPSNAVFHWQIVKEGDNYVLRNVGTGTYITNTSAATSAGSWQTTEDAVLVYNTLTKVTDEESGKVYFAIRNIDYASGYSYMHVDGSKTTVNWEYASSPASQYAIEEVGECDDYDATVRAELLADAKAALNTAVTTAFAETTKVGVGYYKAAVIDPILAARDSAKAVNDNGSAALTDVLAQVRIMQPLLAELKTENVQQPEAGKFYYIQNAYAGFYTTQNKYKNIYQDGTTMKWGNEDRTNFYQVWTWTPKEGGYSVRNIGGDNYVDVANGDTNVMSETDPENATVLTWFALGKCYIQSPNPTEGNHYLHAGSHKDGAGVSGTILGFATGGASSWTLIELTDADLTALADTLIARVDAMTFGHKVGDMDPTSAEAINAAKAALEADKTSTADIKTLYDLLQKNGSATVTVTYTLDGKELETKQIKPALTLDAIKYDKTKLYAEDGKGYYTMADPVYDETNEKYTQNITSSLPFVTSTEGDEHWYAMYIHYTNKWMLKTAGTDNADVKTSEKTFNAADNELWAIAGDIVNGFKLINKATGWSKPMTSPDPSGTASGQTGADILPKMNADEATMWKVYDYNPGSGNHGFYLGYGLTGAKMNRRGNDLAFWTGGQDGGSSFSVVEPWTAYVAYSNELNATKTKVQAIVEGAENVGKIGYTTEQGLANAQDFQTKWAEPAAATTAAQLEQIAAVKALEYPITLPEAGKYIVLKKADGSYLTSGKSFSATEDATTVWYVDEDESGVKRLVSVKGGLYLNGRDFATGTETTPVGAAKFIGANYGCLNIVAGQNGTSDMYLYNGSASLDKGNWAVGTVKTDAEYNWTVEYAPQVTVSVSKAGYASFYTPIALKLTADEGLKAFVATVNGETLSLTTVTDDVIPAGEGVVLRGAQGDYHLQLTTETSAETSMLAGVVLPRISTFKSEGYTGDYVLSTGTIGDKTGQVGFFPVRQNEVLKGFKAYLPDEQEETAVRAFSFSFEEMTTAIEAAESRTMEDGVMYNLNGQRVTRANGLVIVNGKRIVVK